MATTVRIYDSGLSLYEQRELPKRQLVADASLYSASGTEQKRVSTTVPTGATPVIDTDLQFNARGYKDFLIDSQLLFSGDCSDGLTIAFSGSNSGATFDGFVEVLSGSPYYLSGSSTCTFSSDTSFNLIWVKGIFHNDGPAPDGETGVAGIYACVGGGNSVQTIMWSNLIWQVEY